MSAERPMASAYMEWAKLRSHARFNLATSGVPNLPLAELPGALDDLELTGADSYGHVPLLEALAAKEGVAADEIVTALGTSMANHLALAALVAPGDEIIVEQPVYEPILATARYHGAVVTFLERRAEDDYAVDTEALARLLTPRTRLVVLTNLHNPTSALVDTATLERVAELARTVGARVLLDEVYLEAVYDDTPASAFRLAPDVVVVTNSLTKVYGLSGLRCGWIVADRTTARRMARLNDLFGATPVHVAERMSLTALAHLDALRARGRAIVDANRRTLFSFYDRHETFVAPRFAWGTTSFPRVVGVSVERLCTVLRERYETSVVPGAFFGRPEHVRIGLTVDPATFAAGLERLAAALDSIREIRG